MRYRAISGVLFLAIILLAACTGTAEPEQAPLATPSSDDTAIIRLGETQTVTPQPSDAPLTSTPVPEPSATSVPPTVTTTDVPIVAAATTPAATAPPPKDEPPADLEPLLLIGSTADWTATNDIVGIEGTIEIVEVDKVRISGFVSLVAEAPGVDIRLGLDRNFEDGVGVSLKDITGQEYEGRSLTLTIPPGAFDGRSFNSIGVF